MMKIVLLSAFLALANAQSPFSACENGYPLPKNLDFNGCTVEPCELPQGSHADMTITFDAIKDMETMHAEVVAHALGVETPYPLPESDVCKGLTNTACPVVEGEEIVWQTGMDLLEVFPQIAVDLEFSVLDGVDGEGVMCFKIQAQVIDPAKKNN